MPYWDWGGRSYLKLDGLSSNDEGKLAITYVERRIAEIGVGLPLADM